MFSYYGSKGLIVRRYPKPVFDTIVEPFAGSARYSLRYADRSVLINDLDSTIYKIWKLIQSNQPIDWPDDLERGQDIRELGLSEDITKLLGFGIVQGGSKPANKVTSWAVRDKIWERLKRRINKERPRIQHWQITNLDYQKLPDVEATWFIDPPYQHSRRRYQMNDIDYSELSEWCKSRKGQVIVCENDKADWLPFEPLVMTIGQRGLQNECLWVKARE